jgi:hypothetical protein
MTVPYTFANQTGAIPLSELDANFAAVPNFANVANTVNNNSQPNITSVGVLNSLSVTGNTVTNLIFQRAPIISLGANAGFSSNIDTISIGNSAGGNNNQGTYAIAIGSQAGFTNQSNAAISIGQLAGNSSQGSDAIALGQLAGTFNQSSNSISIGYSAGRISQGGNAIAIGNLAGNNTQASNAVAIGDHAGFNNQGDGAIAIGRWAGNLTQSANAIAFGRNAANITQGSEAIAIGHSAGNLNQGPYAVAIGAFAGNNNQGSNSVVIGSFAGYPTVANNAIAINGDTTPLNAPNSGLYISPIRNDNSNVTNTVYYNTTTKELTYSVIAGSDYGNANVANYLPTFSGNLTSLNTITATGNIAGNYFIGNGSQLTGISAGNIIGSYSNADVFAYLGSNSNAVITTTGNITTTANISGNYFIGNGSQLTGIATGLDSEIINGNSSINIASSGSNIVVTVANTQSATFFTTGMSTAGNVTANRIFANADISSTGNITTAGFFIGTFQGNISGNIVVPGSNTQVLYNNSGNAGASAGLTFNSASNAMVVAGNVTASNFIGNISNGTSRISIASSGNVSVGVGPFSTTVLNINTSTGISVLGNVIASGAVSVTGNVTANNFLGSGAISVTGNVTANNFIGGGAGTPAVSSNTNLDLSSPLSVRVLGGGTLRLPALTTSNIANLTPVNGDIIYNSSINKFQGYENGAWGNLI